MKRKERSSNIELLRILGMLLIVIHHYSIHGGWGFSSGVSINKAYIQFLAIGGKLGVNLFVLITGYFMYDSSYKIKNIKKVLSQTWFYSISICLLVYFSKLQDVSLKNVVKSFFPIIFSNYWFVTTFVMLYFLIPFLNIFITNINRKVFEKLLFIITVLLMLPFKIGFGNIDWFILLFFIGAYLKKYSFDFFRCNIKNLIVFLLMYLIIFLSIIIFDLLGMKFSIFLGKELFFIKQNSPFILIASVFIFQFFKNLKITNMRFINDISSTTFGIYLIHDNVFIRKFLWVGVFKNSLYKDSNFSILFIHSLLAVGIVFICCFLIDFLLQKTFFKIFNDFLNLVEAKILNIFNKFSLQKQFIFTPKFRKNKM